ncbi:MAG: DEAD/DEAH box helicase [Catalinimonas sp.]
MSFSDFKLNPQLLRAVADAGFEVPTPVQREVIPQALAGHDVLGIAPTGTGKTAAFVLPLLMRLKYASGEHPRALILGPTRELVIQLNEHVRALNGHTALRHTALYGGTGFKQQTDALQAGLDLIVATPGRLMDHYHRGDLVLKELEVMVLDEADKIMDMGFMPQIRKILEIIPRKRQNLLFSATMPAKVERLSAEFLEFPTRVEVAPQATVTETIEQRAYATPNLATKVQMLDWLLRDEAARRVFVFAKTRETANVIYQHLWEHLRGDVRVIHGNKDQNARLNAMRAFREGEVRVLVATDVAARGIDVREVSHVVNFDVPMVYEDYVHRVGRTGRAELAGTSLTLVNPADEYHLKKIERIIRTPVPRHPLPEGIQVPKTPTAEKQEQAREIDRQRRRDDPSYQGAFHEKKKKPARPPKEKTRRPKPKGGRKRRR